MANVWFCSDFHLGHCGISKKFRKEFSSDEEHDIKLKDLYHNYVKKNDLVFMLGDMAFTIEHLYDMITWPGQKKLILGNHDYMRGNIKLTDLQQVYCEIHGCLSYKGMWLTHFPIHESEFYQKVYNIHGHTHKNLINDKRYVNVCPEILGYEKPLISLDEIRSM